MTDLIIGSAFNLTWDQCKYWVNSINRSDFKGEKIICTFAGSPELMVKFKQNDFEVYDFKELSQGEHICSSRFMAYDAVIRHINKNYRKIIATDVTDVIFQHNPSNFFDKFSGYNLIASSENIRYKDEPWGARNMNLAFGPAAFERMKNKTIYNAGVMAGDQDLMMDMFFAITSLCSGKQQHVPGGGAPDQAAYNIMLSLLPFDNMTKFFGHDDGWACQVGTTADPAKDFSKVNITPSPKLAGNIVKTSKGIDYTIVHQYNRNLAWKQVLEKKYGED
jgi:hypothetical protein